MKNKLFLISLMAGSLSLSLSLGVGVSGLTKTREVNAEDNTTSLGLGAAMLGYINNGGNAVTSNSMFDYTIAVGSLSSGTGSTLGSYPAEYVVRGGNKELGAATADDLNYHTDWALCRMHSQDDSRIQWVITAKVPVTVSVTVAKILSYPGKSELKYYVFDGAIPNEKYCSNQLKQLNVLTSTMDDASSLNYSTTLSIGQKFVVEWGYQWSGKRNINIKSNGAEMFTLGVTRSASKSLNYYNKMVTEVSNNEGNDIENTSLLPLKSYGFYHGSVTDSNINKFETVSNNSLKTTTATQALNWNAKVEAGDNLIIKFVASEKLLLNITRPVIGTDFLNSTFINYWHNGELEKTISFEGNVTDPSLFNYSHVLEANDVFYYEFGSTIGNDRCMQMTSGGDINEMLPKFEALGFAFSSEDLHPSHTLVKVDGKASTCEEYGYKDYYKCSVCDEKFEDSLGQTPILDFEEWKTGDGLIEMSHNLIHHPAKAATATQTGNIEYWECSACGCCYSDSNGLNEIDPSSVIIPINDEVSIKYDIYYNLALTNKKADSNTGDAVASYNNVDVSFNHGSPKNYALMESIYNDYLASEGTNANRKLALFNGWQMRFVSTDDAIIRYTAKVDTKISLNYVPSNPAEGITTWVGNSSIRFYVEDAKGTLALLSKVSITKSKKGNDGEYNISTSLRAGETLLLDLSTTDRNNNDKTVEYSPALVTKPSAFDENEAFDFATYYEVESYKQTKINGFGWWFSSSAGACDVTQDNVLIEHYAYCLDLVSKYKAIYLDATTKAEIDVAASKFISEFKAVSETSKFIFTYMHMRDYDADWNNTEGSNLCLDYYDDAKTTFNSMSSNAKKAFCEDEHFIEAYERLTQWANANAEYIDSDYTIKKSNAFLHVNLFTSDSSSALLVYVLLVLSCLSLVGLVYWRKKHEK